MKRLLLLAILFFHTLTISSQIKEIAISSRNNEVSLTKKTATGITIHFCHNKIYLNAIQSKEGDIFSDLTIKGGYSIGDIGEPKLPAYKKLIKVPAGAIPSVKVLSYSTKEFSLKEKGVTSLVIPVQPSLRKDIDEKDSKFEYHKAVYSKDAYQQPVLANIEVLGTLRSSQIARLIVAPVDYNPVKGIIKVYNDIELEIKYNTDEEKQNLVDSKTFSPYFDIVDRSYFNSETSSFDSHPDLTKYPVKMLIISNRIFEETLRPFILWKQLKGFKVITAYTDEIGSTTDQIKAFIQEQYNSATAEDPAPSFLTIVGDIDQVPASATGSSTGRKTDLYYASVDGDMFPDMYYGRLSATSTTQLENIINKILYYEKYQFADPAYLNEVTLIAGADATWNPKVGQPTILYGTANYFNAGYGFSQVNEYGVSSDPNNPSSISGYTGCYGSDKISVGLINYTAHCSETGWSEPSLSISTVNSFTNTNKYPLAIGNCCLSGDFGYSECVGEAWIRAKDKGAVTYIGSSPSTYWLEDFYWSVGAFPMVGENNGYVPTAEETTLGLYDAPFASNYVTAGAMVFTGNLAVTEADLQNYPTQASPLYYWQAYNILGDPSLMPYLTEADENITNYNETISLGESNFQVTTLKDSYITLSRDGVIIGHAYALETGLVNIPVTPITTTGDVTLAITRPQTIPVFDTITAITPNGPFLTLYNYSINDISGNNNTIADFNETFSVNVKIKNLGTEVCSIPQIVISGLDNYIHLIGDDTISCPDIPAESGSNIIEILNAFSFQVEETVPDQHVAYFTLNFKSTQGDWSSPLKITLNSPALSIDNLVIDDSITGDNNQEFNLGETCNATIDIINNGHSSATGISYQIIIPDSLKNFMSVSYESFNNLNLSASQSQSIPFKITSSPVFSGYVDFPVIIQMSTTNPSGLNYYINTNISLKPNNSVTISNQTITSCFSYFYDSGGETSSYSNSENKTTTIYSADELSVLHISFSSFSTEKNYDYLYIYDGPDTKSPQVTGSPFSGSIIPSDITTLKNSVTFKFVSDGNTIGTGWNSIVECVSLDEVSSYASNPSPANDETNVTYSQLSWDPVGYAQFYEVFLGKTSSPLILINKVVDPEITVELEKNTTYYWKVIPGNYLGMNTLGCETWKFSTDSITNQFVMSNGTVYIDTALFYDSGGPLLSYKNKEDYILTMKPKINGTKLQVIFNSFSIESQASCGYDNLSVYDGLTTSDTELGSFCGTTISSPIDATNSDGALTFKFHSDESETRDGWKALVKAIGLVDYYNLTFEVTENSIPLNNIAVEVNGFVRLSNPDGNVSFSLPNGMAVYRISAAGYEPLSGTLMIDNGDFTKTINLSRCYPVNINVTNGVTDQAIHGVKIITDKDSTYTDSAGIAILALTEGVHTISFTREGFEPLTSVFSIPATESTQSLTLYPSRYNVSIIIKDIEGIGLRNVTTIIDEDTILTGIDGLANYTLPWGTHGISILKKGYISFYTWVTVKDDLEKEITLEPMSSLKNITFNIFGTGPKDTISLADANIDIFIDDLLYSANATNSSGLDTINIPIGFVKYSLTKEGYHPKTVDSVQILDNTVYLTDTLNQKEYRVEFHITCNSTAIADALINLNGYVPVSSDENGIALFNSVGYEKQLQYSVIKSGYSTIRNYLDVETDTIIEISLTQNPVLNNVALKIYGSGPKDTLLLPNTEIDIYINDTVYLNLKTNDTGTDTLLLPTGQIEYTIAKEGYQTKNNISFNVDETTLYLIDTLVQKTYDVRFDVSFHETPIDGALITLNGYKPAYTNSSGIAIFNGIGHEKGLIYIIQKNGYYTAESLVDITQDTLFKINLSPTNIPVISSQPVLIYPNPASDFITIETKIDVQFPEIVGTSGVTYYIKPVVSNNLITININDLPSGLYVIRFHSKNNVNYRGLFVKE